MYTLLHGKEKSSLNLFIVKTYDRSVCVSVLNELASCSENVMALCYHYPSVMYKEKIKGGSRISFRDCFSDPLNWLTPEHSTADELNDELFSELHISKDNSTGKRVIFIDDLLLFGRALKYIDNFGYWQGLIGLIRDLSVNNYLFVFVNPDLVSDGCLRSILHISPFHVNIDVNHNLDGSFHCKSILRKISGKLSSNSVNMKFDEDGKISLIKDEVCVKRKEFSQGVDPASNLTFNLRLTDDEKKARANTALPYILNESSKSTYLDNSSNILLPGGGDVIYMPDEADDFDDEDPDDDLDF